MVRDSCHLPEGKLPGVQHVSFYAIYDGHGGVEAAEFLGQVLFEEILANVIEMPTDVELAIRKAFVDMDALLVGKLGSEGLSIGSTAVVVLILDRLMYTANVGDAEAFLGRRDRSKGEHPLPIALTRVHKISDDDEKKRVLACGGQIFMGRLFGTLAISRAFGDGEMKQPKQPANYVSVEPHISKHELSPDDEFIVMACDGLWDKVTHEEACLYVSKLLHYKTLEEATKFLMDEAMDRNTKDNVTIIVISLDWSIPVNTADELKLEALPKGFLSFLKNSEVMDDEKSFDGVRHRISSPQIKVTTARKDIYRRGEAHEDMQKKNGVVAGSPAAHETGNSSMVEEKLQSSQDGDNEGDEHSGKSVESESGKSDDEGDASSEDAILSAPGAF